MSNINLPSGVRVPRLRIGGSVNYADFDVDGKLILYGAARIEDHFNIGAAALHLGAASPTGGFSGVFPHLAFSSAVNQDVHHQTIIDYKWDLTTDMEVCIAWYYTGAQDNGTVKWEFNYLSVKEGEDPTAAGTTISETTAGSHTTGQIIRTCITTKILKEHLEYKDDFGFKLERDQANDTLATSALLLAVHLHYTKDKLGEPL